MPTLEAVRNSYLEQARLSQAHRWLAACCGELPKSALDGLFHSSVTQNLPYSSLRHPAPGKVVHLPKFKRLEVLSVDGDADNRAEFDLAGVQITAANESEVRQPQVAVALGFTAKPTLEPRVSKLSLEPGGGEVEESGSTGPQEASVQHLASRILSLKHRWHALVESPDKFPERFREITADHFVMDWGSGSVCGYAELAPWVHRSGKLFAAARHEMTAFDWRSASVGQYQAQFRFDWFGLDRDGQPMVARSEHEWQIIDNPAERYPRIAAMSVNLTEPFRAATQEEFNV